MAEEQRFGDVQLRITRAAPGGELCQLYLVLA